MAEGEYQAQRALPPLGRPAPGHPSLVSGVLPGKHLARGCSVPKSPSLGAAGRLGWVRSAWLPVLAQLGPFTFPIGGHDH